MGLWIGIIILGICTLGSLYMTCLAVKSGDSRGPWLFGGIGVFFGIFLLSLGVKAIAQRSAFFKTVDEKISGRPETRSTFVPHWFIMTAILLTVLVIVLFLLINAFK
jgi:uncharacterized membrane protein YidH (DUF202 family)